MTIAENINDVRKKIAAAAERSGRMAQDIQIVAVTKTVPAAAVLDAYRTGQKNFAENRVQEWVRKRDLLPPDCRWHLIGRLQTNKVKYLDERVSLIHSLDRPALLDKLQEEGEKKNIGWMALLQVNAAGDQAKAGVGIDEVEDFLAAAADYPRVIIRGLMTIGALEASPDETRETFRKLKKTRDSLIKKKICRPETFQHLSMGMSQDYEIAVEEGATIVRIGSKIFND